MIAHACTEPDGPLCMTCHGDEGARGRIESRTFVVADEYPRARAWCRKHGVRIFSRGTIFAHGEGVLSRYRIRPADRVVVLGHPKAEVLRELEAARKAGAVYG